jgi:hypothetical protein
MPSLRFANLFWETLAEHRNAPYYRNLRSKLLAIGAHKAISDSQFSGADRSFKNPDLKNVRHIRLIQNPEVTLFYHTSSGVTTFAMLGSHADYGFKGINAKAETRTGIRVHNASVSPERKSPAWPSLRWQDPLDILNNPDLPEMSQDALMDIAEELIEEERDAPRFERRHGCSVLDCHEDIFENYISDVRKASILVHKTINGKVPSTYWLSNIEEANSFKLEERSIQETPRR